MAGIRREEEEEVTEKTVVTRFAPSPTGYMHIGNLRTALYSYLIARHAGGRFILRIEDTDRERLVEGATDIILDTMRTTGLRYDEGPDIGGDHGPYIQSERKAIYAEYAKRLVEKGFAYYCFCSKERLDSLHAEDANGGYDRHCRDLPQEEVDRLLASGQPYVIRQKIPLSGRTSYTDAVFGEIATDNAEMQDQILMKADGYPTYNFAHVVDDHLMGVTHVVRGSEYLTSTPKYVLLYDAFGWERPVYVHLPLLMGRNEDGSISKLSKRHGAVSFADLLADGYLPEAIVNYIALLGWCRKGSEEEFYTLQDLERYFTIDGINKSPSVFDYDKLLWFNGEYIRRMPFDAFCQAVRRFVRTPLPPNVDQEGVFRLLQGRLTRLSEAEEKTGIFRALPEYDTTLMENRKNKVTMELARRILKEAEPVLRALPTWENESLYACMLGLSDTLGCKSGAVLWCMRIAVAGQAVTPGGATEIMAVIGREESLRRLAISLSKLGE